MLKLSTCAVLIVTLSWTGYRAAGAKSAEAPQTAAFDPLKTEGAYRLRNGQPNHWRSYVLNQQR